MALTTKRIINLPTQTDPQEGDYLAIDNGTNGTHKIPVGRIGVELDDTLTEAGKAADAKATGDAIDALRTQLEVTGTASGAIATFTDGADMPAKSVIVNIEPQQSGSGTPSPDNVRQISGWESVNVNVTGVNVWDEEWRNGYYGSNGVFYATSSSPSNLANTNPISVKPNTAYYFKAPNTNGNTVCWYDDDMTLISANTNASFNTVITSPSNAGYLNFKANYTGVTVSSYNNDISINYPSTDHEYHAYTGTTTPVNLGRTVYGGTLDVVSGVLVVDKAMVDLNSLSYERITNGSVYIFQAYIAGKKYPSGTTDFITSCYEVQNSSGFGLANKRCTTGTGSSAFYFRDDDYTDATSFKASLSGQTLVYYLMTPQTYTLTPTEVKTLLGENNVWADAGDVEITYVRDLNIAINNLIGE